jgi:hypothetical protein
VEYYTIFLPFFICMSVHYFLFFLRIFVVIIRGYFQIEMSLTIFISSLLYYSFFLSLFLFLFNLNSKRSTILILKLYFSLNYPECFQISFCQRFRFVLCDQSYFEIEFCHSKIILFHFNYLLNAYSIGNY